MSENYLVLFSEGELGDWHVIPCDSQQIADDTTHSFHRQGVQAFAVDVIKLGSNLLNIDKTGSVLANVVTAIQVSTKPAKQGGKEQLADGWQCSFLESLKGCE
jgi:hypothetical protein